MLEQKDRAKIRSRWMTAACALALVCVCMSPGPTVAQATVSSDTKPSQKTGGTKTASPAQHAKAANESAGNTTASPERPHPASHPVASKHPKSNTASAGHNSKAKYASSRRGKKRTTARGQQKIEPERAQAIQEALIREHYMSGEAAGIWNQASEDAMRRYQADHGWQSKTVPDSRALISLGLGPSHDHLLNPESAMTTEPSSPRAASLTPVSHSVDTAVPLGNTPTTDPVPASTPQDSSGPQ
jgi:hypothetical protein